jgi:hypothetical protein
MKFTEKLYHWFYKKRKYSSRTVVNMINGLGAGLIAWILSIISDKFFGLSTFYWDVSYFMTGGIVLGGIIGMISNEIFLHKEKNEEHSNKE